MRRFCYRVGGRHNALTWSSHWQHLSLPFSWSSLAALAEIKFPKACSMDGTLMVHSGQPLQLAATKTTMGRITGNRTPKNGRQKCVPAIMEEPTTKRSSGEE